MIRPIRFKDLFLSDLGWLRSRFHFSFAEYRNPNNLNFGVLRVMNDDLVDPHQGFGRHPHRDMEIVTYVIQGGLTHQDSMGHRETLGPGDMQYMSAGTGVTHSEMNEGDQESRFLQMWVLPGQKGVAPKYGSKRFEPEERHNRWLQLIGPGEGQVALAQDANFYVTELDAGQALDFQLGENRQVYLKLIEGQADLNGVEIGHGDAAEVLDEDLHLKTQPGAHILLVEMAKF
ncbi:MAG: pirin family protein [bacterium]|nr:pirin family protein [bacterium]